MMKHRYYAYLELTMAAILIGSSVVAGKLMTMQLPVFLSQTASLAIALVLLIPILLLANRKSLIKVGKRDALILLLQAFLGMFLFRVLMLYGLRYASAAESGIVTSLTPAAIALLSFAILKEKLTARLTLGIGCSLFGIVVIQAPGWLMSASVAQSNDSYIGILLILLAVIGEAMLTILRKKTSSGVSPLLGTTYITFFSFLMFLPFSIVEAWQFDFDQVGGGEIGLLLYYGIFVTVGGYILWFRGVSNLPASTAAVYTGCIPVSTLLLSYAVLHEPFSFAHVAGVGFVFMGILLISDFRNLKGSSKSAAPSTTF
ncbi:DMT family transporter [Paenibacillus sedimenti]|uniref:DMT family transporter n=1 Tax=Paenibacillus sedimenti TaxID=2770274 RepID=A0A926KS54_9BACL|nr:DMT family transporter [Paenibacillus sedimenti]MBD0382156.1 DMT family transporter [Paenibacillus sedimenti]